MLDCTRSAAYEPVPAMGGSRSLWLHGSRGALSAGSLVGLVTLLGITIRNAMMLISHYEYLVVSDCRVWNLDTVSKVAVDRLLYILMTAMATALGYVAYSGG